MNKKQVGVVLIIILAMIDAYFLEQASPEIKTIWQAIKPYIKTEVEQASNNSVAETGYIIRVIDGDTIELENGELVRYIGIDTPEFKSNKPDCFAEEAKIANSELVLNKQVKLVKDKTDRDKYNRLLRYVYVSNIWVNEYLVKNGYAFAKEYYPDNSKQAELNLGQESAKQNQAGLWSECY